MNKDDKAKLKRDTGGGCSICGALPVVNVKDSSYWLCGGCVLTKLGDAADAARYQWLRSEIARGDVPEGYLPPYLHRVANPADMDAAIDAQMEFELFDREDKKGQQVREG